MTPFTAESHILDVEDPPESTSDNKQPSGVRRRGRRPTPLPEAYQAIHAGYVELLANTPLDADTRRAYACRVRGYLAWLADSETDTTILDQPPFRDGTVRDYRAQRPTKTVGDQLSDRPVLFRRRQERISASVVASR